MRALSFASFASPAKGDANGKALHGNAFAPFASFASLSHVCAHVARVFSIRVFFLASCTKLKQMKHMKQTAYGTRAARLFHLFQVKHMKQTESFMDDFIGGVA